MKNGADQFRGCLLGMSIGDAMGAPVDARRHASIRDTYGPRGLRGYDTANAPAEITSYAQVGLFACNGLLVSIARGEHTPAAGLKSMTGGLKEWARVQHLPRSPEKRICWLSYIPRVRRRKVMDPRTLDALTRDALGTPMRPVNSGTGPGTLTAAAAVGLYYHPDRLAVGDIGAMGARAVALTHGDSLTFLSGAVLAYGIAGILQDPECPLEEHFLGAAQTVAGQFGGKFPQAGRLKLMIADAVRLARDPAAIHWQNLDRMECDSAAKVLCGGIYAALAAGDNFDDGMVIAVNHSGKSAAVGAVAGAILGARLGESAIPAFYLESLEGADAIRELATDYHQAVAGQNRERLYDQEWDRKYIQGLPREI